MVANETRAMACGDGGGSGGGGAVAAAREQGADLAAAATGTDATSAEVALAWDSTAMAGEAVVALVAAEEAGLATFGRWFQFGNRRRVGGGADAVVAVVACGGGAGAAKGGGAAVGEPPIRSAVEAPGASAMAAQVAEGAVGVAEVAAAGWVAPEDGGASCGGVCDGCGGSSGGGGGSSGGGGGSSARLALRSITAYTCTNASPALRPTEAGVSSCVMRVALAVKLPRRKTVAS